jgi:hypothetical protein
MPPGLEANTLQFGHADCRCVEMDGSREIDMVNSRVLAVSSEGIVILNKSIPAGSTTSRLE